MTSTARRNKGKGRAMEDEKVVAALPLGKQLAHTGASLPSRRNERTLESVADLSDKAVRDRAIRSLVAFVSRGGGAATTLGSGEDIDLEAPAQEAESSSYVRLEDAEMAKLWKGLFYCELRETDPWCVKLTCRFLDVGQTPHSTKPSHLPLLPLTLHLPLPPLHPLPRRMLLGSPLRLARLLPRLLGGDGARMGRSRPITDGQILLAHPAVRQCFFWTAGAGRMEPGGGGGDVRDSGREEWAGSIEVSPCASLHREGADG